MEASKGLSPSHKAHISKSLWNQYETAINKSYRTNNMSEDWHSRFQLVVAKHRADIYTGIEEIQKEQSCTEICTNKLAIGKVKTAPIKKWNELQRCLESIATEYNTRYRYSIYNPLQPM